MSDLKPDATMTEGRCWCASQPDALQWCQWLVVVGGAPGWYRLQKELDFEEKGYFIVGDALRYCPHCASELHRKGALAGWAGPPQEKLKHQLAVCAAWEARVVGFLFAHGWDFDDLLAKARQDVEEAPHV